VAVVLAVLIVIAVAYVARSRVDTPADQRLPGT
jgi:hypothetical protein